MRPVASRPWSMALRRFIHAKIRSIPRSARMKPSGPRRQPGLPDELPKEYNAICARFITWCGNATWLHS